MPARTPGRAGRLRLAAALILPTVLGLVGLRLLRSLTADFLLYLLGGCALVPWLLLGARPLSGAGALPFSPPDGGRRDEREAGRRTARPSRWPAGWRTDLLLALLFGPVLLVVYLAVRPWLGSATDYLQRLLALGIDLRRPVVTVVAFLLLNPLLEEWWWRGQATPRCRAAFGPRAGLALVTGAFGLYHVVVLGALFTWPIALLRSLLISAAGLVWSLVAVREGGWRAAYVAHLAADGAIAAVVWLWILPRG